MIRHVGPIAPEFKNEKGITHILYFETSTLAKTTYASQTTLIHFRPRRVGEIIVVLRSSLYPKKLGTILSTLARKSLGTKVKMYVTN